jgi:RNA polymerase sigma-70 factor (ECF subfamily)
MQSGIAEFDRIYAEHHIRILRYLTRMVGVQDAEDLAQEVFIRAAKAYEDFRHEAKIETWLYRIATHVAVDRLRGTASRRETLLGQELDEVAADGRETVSSLEEKTLRRAANECIRNVIYGLPENYRTPLILSELEGFTNREIAEIMDVSLDTVKIRLHRAKEQLKQALLDACQFSRDERNELTCDPLNSGEDPDRANRG